MIKIEKELPFHIFLIGFMGTGKSTVGKLLGKILSRPVLEMDEEIVRREGMDIPEIFRVHGEEYFRERETSLLRELQGQKPLIVSCGGGVPLREENVREMKKAGTIIWLTAKPETILRRVRNDENRPLLKGKKNRKEIQKLMDARRERYDAAGDILVSTDYKRVIEICQDILDALGAF